MAVGEGHVELVVPRAEGGGWTLFPNIGFNINILNTDNIKITILKFPMPIFDTKFSIMSKEHKFIPL